MDISVDWLPRTAAYLEERKKLRSSLREDFDTLVKMYRYYAAIHHKQPFVSYKVLADLIREGWRLSAEPIDLEQ